MQTPVWQLRSIKRGAVDYAPDLEFQLPQPKKFIALKLADNAHDDGTHVFPSVDTIADMVVSSENTVRKYIKELLEDEILEPEPWENEGAGSRIPKNRRPNRYQFNMDRLMELVKAAEHIARKTKSSPSEPQKLRGSTHIDQGFNSHRSGVQSCCSQTINKRHRTSDGEISPSSNGASESAVADADGEPGDSLAAKWRAMCEILDNHLEKGTVKSWLAPLVPIDFDADTKTLTLKAPTKFIGDYVRQHYTATIGKSIGGKVEITAKPWKEINAERAQAAE